MLQKMFLSSSNAAQRKHHFRQDMTTKACNLVVREFRDGSGVRCDIAKLFLGASSLLHSLPIPLGWNWTLGSCLDVVHVMQPRYNRIGHEPGV